jgi:stage V sporulation protein R
VLDAAHALMDARRRPLSRRRRISICAEEKRAERAPRPRGEPTTISGAPCRPADQERGSPERAIERRRALLGLPRRTSSISSRRSRRAQPWQRELLRIVRNISQYFYPQKQTKVMNEGCATFVHYTHHEPLHDKGLITDGALLEFLHSAHQRGVPAGIRRSALFGFNPYALGFAMMQDIERICTDPTDEDREWFPEIAGKGDPMARAARRLGQLPRRKLHQPVPEPAADARRMNCRRMHS